MISNPSRSLPTQLAWHALALLCFVCLPLLKFRVPWWGIPRAEIVALLVLLAAYGASALAVLLFVKTYGWRAAGRALLITLAVFCVFLAVLLLKRGPTPRYLLLPIFGIALILIPLSVATRPIRLAGLAVLGVALLGVAGLSARAIVTPAAPATKNVESIVTTAFYALRISSHEGAIPMPATRGGGLDRLGDHVLLGTGDGHLYLLKPGTGSELNIEELPTLVPANREEFARAFGGSSRAPLRSADYSSAGPPRTQTWRFRVADVITQTSDDEVRIYASHHYYNAQDGCFLVRLSLLTTPRSTFPQSVRGARWQTIYDSQPCIPMTGKLRKRGKNPFRGEEIGGRLAFLDPRTLLLTLGDHGFYGGESVQAFSQDPQAAYGKVIRIDLDTRASRIYTMGHRNPQGLYVAKDGHIWSTEHAAQGGDELNLLVENSNYGWPNVTYGTDYGTFGWQANPHQGRHAGYAQPAYVWVPSIGASNLIGIEHDRLGTWRGDLIVGSLATRSLYRLALDGERAVLSEPIPINKRVRDLLELNDGRLMVWTDDAAILTIEPASGMDGAAQFGMLCSGCHQMEDGIAHRIGPDLYGVLDRKIAGAPGYDEYSQALLQLGGTWTRQRLDAFLRDPQAMAPGTTMAFAGVKDDKLRAALIDHLDKVSQQPPPTR